MADSYKRQSLSRLNFVDCQPVSREGCLVAKLSLGFTPAKARRRTAEHESKRYMLIEPVWCACSPVHLGASQTCYCLSVELTCPTYELSILEANRTSSAIQRSRAERPSRTPENLCSLATTKAPKKAAESIQNPTYMRGWRLLECKDLARSRTQPNESNHQPETAMHHPSKNHERAFNLSIRTKY